MNEELEQLYGELVDECRDRLVLVTDDEAGALRELARRMTNEAEAIDE